MILFNFTHPLGPNRQGKNRRIDLILFSVLKGGLASLVVVAEDDRVCMQQSIIGRHLTPCSTYAAGLYMLMLL